MIFRKSLGWPLGHSPSCNRIFTKLSKMKVVGTFREFMVVVIMISTIFTINGCSENTPLLTVTGTENKLILDYLDQKVFSPNFRGKVFSAYKLLGRETGKLYIWATIQEYYKKDGILETGTGWSVPLVLNLAESSGSEKITSHISPRDGSLYSKDIEKLFPRVLQKTILYFPSNSEQVKEVGRKLNERVNMWTEEK